ncbi:hypothetical protein DJ94_5599 [Bacillus pseudomycoides]|nr:hypothetical protein DJ94_5599 [Bacillus pseudomycoides]
MQQIQSQSLKMVYMSLTFQLQQYFQGQLPSALEFPLMATYLQITFQQTQLEVQLHFQQLKL